jgi:hypothetical protein
MIDVEHAVIVNVEATPARTYDEVAATRMMIDRTETTFGLKPGRLAADTAYGTGKLLAWLLDKDITPHIPASAGRSLNPLICSECSPAVAEVRVPLGHCHLRSVYYHRRPIRHSAVQLCLGAALRPLGNGRFTLE